VKNWFVVIALCSMAGLVCAAPDELEDTFNSLKAATEVKKDPDAVKRLAPQAAKLARAAVAAPQPSDAEQVETWKAKVEYAKGVDTYSEYALATAAQQQGISPEKSVDLIEALIALNPKSKYLDARVTFAYMTALEGSAISNSGRSPDRAVMYANKLEAAARKPKPEGLADADWERIKNQSLGTGLYITGMAHGQKQSWIDCNRDLTAAVPYVQKDTARLGPLYLQLGLCNYQIGKITQDRSKLIAAEKYSELSAAIPGPAQAQANQNVITMKRELGGGTATKR
jgi:hypothetical protein